MAIPSTEEVVAPETTVEAVVAQVAAEPVKAVHVEKEVSTSPTAAPTKPEARTPSIEEAPKTEDAPKIEESTESPSSDQEQDSSEANLVELSIPEWKEESNLVSDLKESEKKALEEFKVRIQQAIKDGEFKVPKKAVSFKASKEDDSAKAPEPVVASAEERKEDEAPVATVEAAETPVAVAETSATPMTDSSALVEEKAKDVSSTAAAVAEAKPAEKATPIEAKVGQESAVVTKVKVEAKTAPVVAEKIDAKVANVVVEKVEAKAAPVLPKKVKEAKAAPVVAENLEMKTAPAVADKVEAKVANVVVEKVEAKAAPVLPKKGKEAKAAPVVAENLEMKTASAVADKVEAKVANVVVEKVEEKAAPVLPKKVKEAKAAPVVAENLEMKTAPAVADKVEAKVAATTIETVEKKGDSEKVPAESLNDTTSADVAVAVSQDAEAEAAEAEAEEEAEDSTPPEDVSLWGVPLLYTKGDKRTDVVLLKFLRAREFNVKESFKQLRNTIIWRKTFNADNLVDEEFGTDLDGAAFMHGVARDGQPVCYNVSGVFQDKELYQKTFGDAEKLNTFLRWRVQVLEKGIQLLSFTPEGPSAMIQITDLKNVPGPGKKDFKAAANQAITILQDNYPELSSTRVFINVPKYFSAVYAVFSPLLTKRTKSKFVVAPAGKNSVTECLLKLISAENIPVQYGGLSRPNDPEFTPGSAPVHEIVLRGGKSTQIDIDVPEVGSTVVWDFSVIGFDVTYGAEFVPTAEGSYTIIIEKSKKLPSTTEEPVRNKFKVTTPGKVVFTVGNISRKKKTILYRYIVKGTLAGAVETS